MQFKVVDIINGFPTFEVPFNTILKSCKAGGAIKILEPLEYHTEQQRKWYKGPCLTGLSDWNGDTKDEWDLRLKALCNGNELLKKETILIGKNQTCTRLTIVGVSKKNLTQFIENILSLAVTKGWPVTPPDSELRANKGAK